MSNPSKKAARKSRRAFRTRAALTAVGVPRTRVSVFRSARHIYAQVIDDVAQKTLASSSTLTIKKTAGDKSALAKAVGVQLAGRVKELGIKAVVFDRGSFLYHGRVRQLAEGLREGGLSI